jgi:hypothetical protein
MRKIVFIFEKKFYVNNLIFKICSVSGPAFLNGHAATAVDVAAGYVRSAGMARNPVENSGFRNCVGCGCMPVAKTRVMVGIVGKHFA